LSDFSYAKSFANISGANPDDVTLQNYLAWSLRNVLRRGAMTPAGNYNINPVNTGVAICVDVHRTKFTNLFPGRNYLTVSLTGTTDEIIQSLNTTADVFEAHLATESVADRVRALLTSYDL